jgi:hypothetical protein
MTEPQFQYLIGLIGKAYAGDAAKRTAALLEAAGYDFNAASAKIDLYKASASGAPAAVAVVQPVQAVLAYDVPAGHYYVNGQHVYVQKGKYGGAKYLKVGAAWVGSFLSQKAIVWLNEHLGSQDVAYACVLEYAKVTHKCGVCNTKLTDPKSIAAKIGPVCAKKYGKSI